MYNQEGDLRVVNLTFFFVLHTTPLAHSTPYCNVKLTRREAFSDRTPPSQRKFRQRIPTLDGFPPKFKEPLQIDLCIEVAV